MEIQVFKEASKIPEKFLPSLVDAEIECWGSEPFKEFLKCSNPKCGKLHSIEDIYGNLKCYKDRKEEKSHNCECGSSCEEVYPKDEFLETAKEYVKGRVSAVLLINDEGIVRGFGIISVNTLGNLLDFELATRPNSYDKDELLGELSRAIFGRDDASLEEVTILHQIFVGEDVRRGNIAFEMLKKLVLANPEYADIPVIGETRFDGDFYPILRTIGCENVIADKHGYIVQYLKKYGILIQFLNENESFSQRGVMGNILKFKKEVKNMLPLPDKTLKYAI